EYEIRRVKAAEVDGAIFLAFKTFLEFEAPDYGEEGVKTFRRDLVENADFKKNCLNGTNKIWGAFDGEKIVGVIGMRGRSHVTMVFVDKNYHRRGIATAIFKRMIEDIRAQDPDIKKITVNSAPYGKPFYMNAGFKATDTEQFLNGIRYTPMEYEL
ncbi:MAG: GNAT family N-acetyltransferase, partial [Candidatus Coproplasma sp.]